MTDKPILFRPIADAPLEGEFFAFDVHGDLIRVCRFPAAGAYPFKDCVINCRTGRFWKVSQWLPLDALANAEPQP